MVCLRTLIMKKFKIIILTLVGVLAFQASALHAQSKPAHAEKATFGMGCFWCSEAIFQRLKGVTKVQSGYAGGAVKNPTYQDVCTGNTGHAEVIQVTFNPSVISYTELLEIFWKMHDPTTLNQQGADVGTQYRSVVFYHNAAQKQLAEAYKTELNKQKVYPNPIVTAVDPYSNFYVAENYHQNYFNLNGSKPYCRMVIQPKVDKLEKVFKQKLKL
jgi:peptide-methionine (S)-S-oxide reductase